MNPKSLNSSAKRPRARNASSSTRYRGKTPPPGVSARQATSEEADRIARALDRLIHGWVIAEVQCRFHRETQQEMT